MKCRFGLAQECPETCSGVAAGLFLSDEQADQAKVMGLRVEPPEIDQDWPAIFVCEQGLLEKNREVIDKIGRIDPYYTREEISKRLGEALILDENLKYLFARDEINNALRTTGGETL